MAKKFSLKKFMKDREKSYQESKKGVHLHKGGIFDIPDTINIEEE